MKKVVMSLGIMSLMVSILNGCSLGSSVETMKDWSFQYNEGTEDYSLFFGLCDKSENYVSASATVDISIW